MTNFRTAAATAVIALGIAVGVSTPVQAEDSMPTTAPASTVASVNDGLSLPAAVAQRAAAAGTLAGKATVCKVQADTLRSSFMAMEKADDWTTAQIASIEMVFTVSQKIYVDQAGDQGCTDAMRKEVAATVDRVVVQLDAAADYLIEVAGRPTEGWIASAPSNGL